MVRIFDTNHAIAHLNGDPRLIDGIDVDDWLIKRIPPAG